MGLCSLRFAIGDEVRCRAANKWRPGVIAKLGYWAGRSMCPYQVKLEDGSMFYAPHDDDNVIRPDAADFDESAPPKVTALPPTAGISAWAQYMKKD